MVAAARRHRARTVEAQPPGNYTGRLWRFIKPVSESSGTGTTIVGGNGRTDLKGQTMPDERNVAHDKKVQQDKEDRGEEIAPGAAGTPQPGRKPRMEDHAGDGGSASEVAD